MSTQPQAKTPARIPIGHYCQTTNLKLQVLDLGAEPMTLLGPGGQALHPSRVLFSIGNSVWNILCWDFSGRSVGSCVLSFGSSAKYLVRNLWQRGASPVVAVFFPLLPTTATTNICSTSLAASFPTERKRTNASKFGLDSSLQVSVRGYWTQLACFLELLLVVGQFRVVVHSSAGH